jgi:putative restriction endonuclease
MKFYIGVTDNEWFRFLSERNSEEVNFWSPTPKPLFATPAAIGMPFLFKLKRPFNHIAGGGFFVTWSNMPVRLAWDVFGDKNGAASLSDFEELLDPLRGKNSFSREIGCTVLSNCFFLPREAWLPDPEGFSTNLMRGKMYDSDVQPGSALWQRLEAFFSDPDTRLQASSRSASVIRDAPRFSEPALIRQRLGQAAFRVLVTNAYRKKCAITGESTLVALEAAHILPYSMSGQHSVSNGMLMRADFHRLFDQGLVTVTPEYRIKVSPRIREAWFNGKVYYRLNNEPLAVLPDNPLEQPNRDYLGWHMQNCYVE